jgi:hypothetical protein
MGLVALGGAVLGAGGGALALSGAPARAAPA